MVLKNYATILNYFNVGVILNENLFETMVFNVSVILNAHRYDEGSCG